MFPPVLVRARGTYQGSEYLGTWGGIPGTTGTTYPYRGKGTGTGTTYSRYVVPKVVSLSLPSPRTQPGRVVSLPLL